MVCFSPLTSPQLYILNEMNSIAVHYHIGLPVFEFVQIYMNLYLSALAPGFYCHVEIIDFE